MNSYENADKDIAVWINGIIVAHILPKTSEKIIVPNGNLRVEAADTTLSRGNWTTGSKKNITMSANSNCTIVSLATRYGALLNLAIKGTTAIGGGTVTPVQPTRPSAANVLPFTRPTAPSSASTAGDGSQAFSLETAVNRAAQVIIDSVPSGSTLAVLSIATNDLEVAEFVIEELAYLMVESKKFRVVDRKSLDAVRAEHSFQISGDVDDNSAISFGKMLGASTVITGSVSGTGATRRLRAKALNVQTAEILAMASERY